MVLLAADDVEEPGALGAEGQQHHLQDGGDNGDPQQHGPELLANQQRLQTKDLPGQGETDN